MTTPGHVVTVEEDHGAKMDRLQCILDQFEITIATANDLVALEDYEVVVIADDSSSMMRPAAPMELLNKDGHNATRWQELQETLGLIVEIGNCFDDTGVDVFFLNNDKVSDCKSKRDERLVKILGGEPKGSTPLVEQLRRVTKESSSEKPILLFILTDGIPNGGPRHLINELTTIVRSSWPKVKVQIMALTGEDAEIGWLNLVDTAFPEVDVTDDYYSERKEVLATRKAKDFKRSDWCLKAMLGPVNRKFDLSDEGFLARLAAAECNVCSIQ